MHFEDIWNTAEEISSELPKQSQEEILKRLSTLVDRLGQVITLKERSEIVGEILFELCSYCKQEEIAGNTINSAAALQLIIERRKEALMEE